MARRAGKLRQLSPADQWLAVQVVGLLVLVRIGLWTLPFRVVQAFAARRGNRTVSPEAKRLSAQQLTSLVTAGADYVPGASCLTRALVAQAILKRYRYEPALRIGVARSPAGQFQAHAWLECEGRVIIGDADTLEKYARFPELQSPTALK